ncbi:phosphonate metabolism transcriptional regulator PhnF [Rubellimicrobium sp. CFH 75288]|uniref:phosphonate metabolism transcriptional regulator PhnF n=1 Tax=Rubellimicrobium sp. CFH 75288 TaxID=2697034 RepID=UPI0014132088|nr:phosphonate metabolism transcriptional regulator PhnF [Rubellimicrobium sp. CFH 75288]NAZ36491.1 phosphonate metabolism transcriptional regulator PhnF [Rubellimicrobium sp. CFH 75288]
MTEPRPSLRRSVAEALRADLRAGRWRPGERLPSEAELALRFGVHRHTLREALARLAAEGLVASRRGAGHFVLSPPAEYPIGRTVRFGENIRAAGRLPGRADSVIATRAADAEEAGALRLAPGAPVHVYEGVSLASGEPVALFRSVFPAERLPGLPEALRAQGSTTAALAACGVAGHRRVVTRLSAVPALPHEAARLHLAPPAALLRSVYLNADPEGRPVEYGTTLWAGGRVTLRFDGEP